MLLNKMLSSFGYEFKKTEKLEEKSMSLGSPSNWGDYKAFNLDKFSSDKLEEIFQTNSVVFRSIQLIGECAHNMKVLTKNYELKNYLEENFQYIVTQLLIHGNCFIHKDLFVVPINQVSIIVNKSNQLVGYKLGQSKVLTKDIIHIKYTDYKSSGFYDVSPIEVCKKWIQIYENIENYIDGLVRYGGKPSGILTYNSMMNEKDRSILKEQFRELYGKVNNGGSVILTSSNISWQPIGLEPEKLKLLENLTTARREISSCFGVSPILLGLVENATFANYKEARSQLWEDVVIPLSKKIIKKISQFFQINIEINSQNFSLLKERFWDRDILTRREKRRLLGYEDREKEEKEE